MFKLQIEALDHKPRFYLASDLRPASARYSLAEQVQSPGERAILTGKQPSLVIILVTFGIGVVSSSQSYLYRWACRED